MIFTKHEFYVKLTTVDDVKRFVEVAMLCPYEITASHKQFVVDGTSLLGLFSLDLSNPIKITLTCDMAISSDTLNAFQEFMIE